MRGNFQGLEPCQIKNSKILNFRLHKIQRSRENYANYVRIRQCCQNISNCLDVKNFHNHFLNFRRVEGGFWQKIACQTGYRFAFARQACIQQTVLPSGPVAAAAPGPAPQAPMSAIEQASTTGRKAVAGALA